MGQLQTTKSPEHENLWNFYSMVMNAACILLWKIHVLIVLSHHIFMLLWHVASEQSDSDEIKPFSVPLLLIFNCFQLLVCYY